jgi:hypothetical protein
MAKQTFTTGQVLTAAQMTSLQQTAMGGGSTTAKTTSYTLVAADAGTVIQMNSASSTTITVNTALFAAGDTVQIQNIGAGVCTVTAGTATVNTAGSLALSQYEGGQLYFNTTSAAFFFDIVQSTSGSGKVLQVVSATTTTGTNIATTTMTDTTITATITPTLNTSKILAILSVCVRGEVSTGAILVAARLLRGATNIADYGGTGSTARFLRSSTSDWLGILSVTAIDSPATTSATTYKLQAAVESTANSQTAQFQLSSTPSTITLLEIGV